MTGSVVLSQSFMGGILFRPGKGRGYPTALPLRDIARSEFARCDHCHREKGEYSRTGDG